MMYPKRDLTQAETQMLIDLVEAIYEVYRPRERAADEVVKAAEAAVEIARSKTADHPAVKRWNWLQTREGQDELRRLASEDGGRAFHELKAEVESALAPVRDAEAGLSAARDARGDVRTGFEWEGRRSSYLMGLRIGFRLGIHQMALAFQDRSANETLILQLLEVMAVPAAADSLLAALQEKDARDGSPEEAQCLVVSRGGPEQ